MRLFLIVEFFLKFSTFHIMLYVCFYLFLSYQFTDTFKTLLEVKVVPMPSFLNIGPLMWAFVGNKQEN